MLTPHPKHIARAFAWISFVLPILLAVRLYFEFFALYPGRGRATEVFEQIFNRGINDGLWRASLIFVLALACCMAWAFALRWLEVFAVKRWKQKPSL